MLPKPNEFYQDLADLVTQVVKRPFRDEPVTLDELDSIGDKVALFIAELKNKEKI